MTLVTSSLEQPQSQCDKYILDQKSMDVEVSEEMIGFKGHSCDIKKKI